MIPLRDHNPSGTFPFITYLIISANIFIFTLNFLMTDRELERFIYQYALIPALVTQGQMLYTFITSLFLHGGIGHIVGNMLFLNIFGDNLEDKLGHLKYLLYYLICGITASLAQILIDPTSMIPNLGASGAIAGLMGGYLLLFPGHRIDILLTLGFYFKKITVPAFTILFYWLAAQVFSGFGTLAVTDQITGGVAYFAHIGGFLAGFLLLIPFIGRLRSS